MAGMHLPSEHNMAAAARLVSATVVENLEKRQCFNMALVFLFLDPTEDPLEVIL